MLAGYRHQISFLVSNLEQNIDLLESTVVTGSLDESVIKPKVDQVQKSMDKYQQGMKTIKAVFVLCLYYYGVQSSFELLFMPLELCVLIGYLRLPRRKKTKGRCQES